MLAFLQEHCTLSPDEPPLQVAVRVLKLCCEIGSHIVEVGLKLAK